MERAYALPSSPALGAIPSTFRAPPGPPPGRPGSRVLRLHSVFCNRQNLTSADQGPPDANMGWASSAVVQTVISFVVLGSLKRWGVIK